MSAPVAEGPNPPSFPPRTPPPPKKPVSPPPPDLLRDGDDPGRAAAGPVLRGVGMRNRRGANWSYESAAWVPAKARRTVLEQLVVWGHRPGPGAVRALGAATDLLVTTAVADGGRKVSVHLSDQDGQACVVVLSHRCGLAPGQAPDGDDVLHRVTALPGVEGCGTETGPEGRRLWAVVGL
ncbi:hypothetical protein [Streptomyces sp. NBC_00102]|uniref:hypothetical protein n=1 Tax=Streptomyces sp. NBC_00102 TaxID=2975652 RepID=UPI002253F088|nr:hypothetical protein [Streptomyces sp. NBC_00102]MCX5401924.1 hypothetical protein [Streptomyces sp. NBC_00102]